MKRSFVPLALAALALSPTSVFAQPWEPAADHVPDQLIVLLADEGAGLTSLVRSADGTEKPGTPADLRVGDPQRIRFVIPDRFRGRAPLEKLTAALLEQEDAGTTLQRYLVFHYPPDTDLDSLETALRRNPRVLWVGKNRLFGISSSPSDPFFPQTPVPSEHQWGLHALNLPAAWDITKGHSAIGVLDTGIDTTHPDLRALDDSGNYLGGNFRPHLSYNHDLANSNVDEGCGGTPCTTPSRAGHGTHVAGIAAATTDNFEGIAGACWHCDLIIGAVDYAASFGIPESYWVAGLYGAVANGAQILSLSFGYRMIQGVGYHVCSTEPQNIACVSLSFANQRDVMIFAATGNDESSSIDFPAIDSRVVAVGATDSNGQLWNDSDLFPFPFASNYDPKQLLAPGKDVVSTFYRGIPFSPPTCDDSGLAPPDDGYGPCSGTSMAAPYLAGSAGLLRSLNPLLDRLDVEDALEASIVNPPGWNLDHGKGQPDVRAAAEMVLGWSGGQLLNNRLTPLFAGYSSTEGAHPYSTSPQRMESLFFDSATTFIAQLSAPKTPGYDRFPDNGQCNVGGCPWKPHAWFYLFSTDTAPWPGSPDLVPLFRLSKTVQQPTVDPEQTIAPAVSSFAYTTEVAGIEFFRDRGYDLDGREGYLFPNTAPKPLGAEDVHRLYHPALDDYVLIPESELTAHFDAGYISELPLTQVIGYAYPNTDTDGDTLIDGFETVAGTDPASLDSDCDGKTDGGEIHTFPYDDPLDANHCPTGPIIFEDRFEGFDLSSWDGQWVPGAGGLDTSPAAALMGLRGLRVELDGTTQAFLVFDTVEIENHFNASFLLDPESLTMGKGMALLAGLEWPSPYALQLRIRRSDAQYQLKLDAWEDGGQVATIPSWAPIGDDLNAVRIEWWAASAPGANDGGIRLWLDGQLAGERAGLDNDGRSIGRVRFGAIGVKLGTSGTFYLDEFRAWQ